MLAHKCGLGSTFTKKYKTTDLFNYEKIFGIDDAIKREKQLKNWHSEWKWNLAKEENPELKDLAADWFAKEEMDEYIEMKS